MWQVIQVYISWNDKSLPAPKLQLAWFDRVAVKAGKGQRVPFTVAPRSMALWVNQGWTIPSGEQSFITLWRASFCKVVVRNRS